MKYIISGIIIVLVLSFGIYLINMPEKLGNINHSSASPEESVSDISFYGEAGDKIKFSFASNIEKGKLDITVYDSEGNVIKELDRAKRLETFLYLDKSDTYTLAAEYKDFIGSFKISVYKSN